MKLKKIRMLFSGKTLRLRKSMKLCNDYKAGGFKQNYSSSMLLDKKTLQQFFP